MSVKISLRSQRDFHGHSRPEPVRGSQLPALERYDQGRRDLFGPSGDGDTNDRGNPGHNRAEARESTQGNRGDGWIPTLHHAHGFRVAATGRFESIARVSVPAASVNAMVA